MKAVVLLGLVVSAAAMPQFGDQFGDAFGNANAQSTQGLTDQSGIQSGSAQASGHAFDGASSFNSASSDVSQSDGPFGRDQNSNNQATSFQEGGDPDFGVFDQGDPDFSQGGQNFNGDPSFDTQGGDPGFCGDYC